MSDYDFGFNLTEAMGLQGSEEYMKTWLLQCYANKNSF